MTCIEIQDGLFEERSFWSKVCKKSSDECWDWIGSILSNGYGCIGIEGITKYAHRISWQLHNGSIPKDMCILHTCDNRKCVNPNHLYCGTKGDNARDRSMRFEGIYIGGRINKFSISDVEDMRVLILDGNTQISIAKTYGTSQSYISDLLNGKAGAHLID